MGLFKQEDLPSVLEFPDTIDLSFMTPEMLDSEDGDNPYIYNNRVIFYLDTLYIDTYGDEFRPRDDAEREEAFHISPIVKIPGTKVGVMDIVFNQNGVIGLDLRYMASDDDAEYININNEKYNIVLPKWLMFKGKSALRRLVPDKPNI